jgi:hypothetical protein
MTIKRVAMSVTEIEALAEDMLTAAIKVAMDKIGAFDGGVGSHIFDDNIAQRKLGQYISAQLCDNYHTKNKLL